MKLYWLTLSLLLVSTGASAASPIKPSYICAEPHTGRPVVELEFKRNRFGRFQQWVKVKRDFYVDDFLVKAGSKFFSDEIPVHINLDNCGDGSFLGVTGIDKQTSELIFLCDMSIGPQYTVFISELVCN